MDTDSQTLLVFKHSRYSDIIIHSEESLFIIYGVKHSITHYKNPILLDNKFEGESGEVEEKS